MKMKKLTILNILLAIFLCLGIWWGPLSKLVTELPFYVPGLISLFVLVSSVLLLIKTKNKWNILSLIIVLLPFLFYLFIAVVIIFKIPLAP